MTEALAIGRFVAGAVWHVLPAFLLSVALGVLIRALKLDGMIRQAVDARVGLAVVLAEQNVRLALDVGDRHYIIDNGQIRFSGTSAAILGNEEIMATYLGVSERRGPEPGAGAGR